MAPKRIPILYLILAVLILVSVVPLYFFGTRVVEMSRVRLKTGEMMLQSTVTQSLSEEIAQRHSNLRSMLENLSSAVQVASGGNLAAQNVAAPELRALLENFVTSTDTIAYATLLNAEARGIVAGRITPDAFMQRELEYAFAAAHEGREYTGQALRVGDGSEARTVVVVSTPIRLGGRFIGMVGTAVDLQYILQRLQDAGRRGLTAYVVDRGGRLVAGATREYSTGQDMTHLEIVQNFVEQRAEAAASILHVGAATSEFRAREGDAMVEMLGTYSPVTTLEWAVVAQKTQRDAYAEVFEMQRTAQMLAILAVLVSLMISSLAARQIITPLRTLTESSRAIARGDFSQRISLKSRTEIGELAQTFNLMSDDLERFVAELKAAAEENRALFLGSIQMLAGAVDEKDPYTRGHSDRVTRYSVLIATEMGLSADEIQKVRISAQLHDVGKIGIEDRILKKPGALTPDEFEIMKTHTTKGATILRPVEQLRDAIPGIELHHESLDGRGYPYGLKGDKIPLMPRIIMVADTFDAMTTNRPYQAAMEPEYVLRIIHSLVNTKFDPRAVEALERALASGKLRLHRAGMVSADEAAAAAAAAGGDAGFDLAGDVERSRI
jgi:HD-GYP domain-containing protein (c-di-GMP phosphodiesterase class II)